MIQPMLLPNLPCRGRLSRCAVVLLLLAPWTTGCRSFGFGHDRLQPEPPLLSPSAATKLTAAVGGPPLPTQHQLALSQFLFFADFDLKSYRKQLEELGDLREQVYQELKLPPAATRIQVYIFADQAKYREYMGFWYRDLPDRRAFFISQPRFGGGDDLSVYTFWGDHLRLDLRHELTHALLHSVLHEVPLWLDEGIAEFFELPPEYQGVNPDHLQTLRTQSFRPDLARLERLTQVDHMKKPEYREAWAWVHMMLRDRGEARRVLLEYLQQLRQPTPAPPLLPRLVQVYGDPNEALLRHLASLSVPKAVSLNQSKK